MSTLNKVYSYVSNSGLMRTYDILYDPVSHYVNVVMAGENDLSYNEPYIGEVVYSETEGTILHKVIYDGYNDAHYEYETIVIEDPDPDPEEPPVGTIYSSTKTYSAVCPTNYSGQCNVEVTRTSNISQADADAKALAAAKAEAETNLVCTVNLNFETIEDAVTEEGFTVSYMPELKSWTGDHDYRPTHMLSMGKRVFVADRSVLEELNKGLPGTYFGITYDSLLSVTFNTSPLITKVADNLFTQSTECFDKISVTNSYQNCNTKDIALIEQFDYDMSIDVVAKRKNSNYQMNIPRTDEETRFRDKFNTVHLTVDNNNHTEFTVNYLTLLFRQNAR